MKGFQFWIRLTPCSPIFLFLNIYSCYFVRHCGSRTAGEALFCNSPKEYPEKAATIAAPLKKTQGFPLRQHHYHAVPELAHAEQHVRSDSWHKKAHDNSTASMACQGGLRVKVTSKTGVSLYLMNSNMCTVFSFLNLFSLFVC